MVRNSAGLLPLKVRADERIAVAIPRPEDLTPADTSSYEQPELAKSLRRYHPHVDGFSFDINPGSEEIAHLCNQLSGYDLIIIGTINANANAGQVVLMERLRKSGRRMIAVALRLPYDIACYPAIRTYVCTYSILPPSMEALADALFGHVPFRGKLPVKIPGL
jgi:beta-N-acetylhexosaminidase